MTHTPLSLLAEFGPLSRDTIARSLDLPWVDVVEHVGKLQRQGFVTPASPTRWEVTKAGRALAQRLAATEAEAAQRAADVPEPGAWFSWPTKLRRRAC